MTSTGQLMVDRLRPVSLEELNHRAALLQRDENKYVGTIDHVTEIVGGLSGTFDVLTIDGHRSFGYETVYFDTRHRRLFDQHAQGRRRRMKVRSRLYLDSGLCFFEVKLKGRRGRTIKHRLAYDAARHGRLDGEAVGFLRHAVAETYRDVPPPRLGPSLAMRYRRVTLVSKTSPERLTIDFDLSYRSFGHLAATTAGARGDAGSGLTGFGRVPDVAGVPDAPDVADVADVPGVAKVVSTPSDLAIVEVKSEAGAGLADRRFRQSGMRSSRCSKYCVGVILTDPAAKYNRFKPVLVRHFDWTSPTDR